MGKRKEELARLRGEAYAALSRGDAQAARAAVEAILPYSRTEALQLRTCLGIETGDAGGAAAALAELEAEDGGAPYTRYLAARVAFMKGARAALIEPLEALLRAQPPDGIKERAYNLLGRCCRQLGAREKASRYDLEAAKAARDPALARQEYSNYLFGLHYLPGLALSAQRAAAARCDAFFRGGRRFRHRRRAAGEKLRVGYISPDFRRHVVLRFSAAMLWRGAPDMTVCAYMTGREDAYSETAARHVDVWRNLCGLSAEAAARRIYEDGIDILVDLAGHTRGSVLPVLAYKPAPVQISGIGYWASTGLSAVDYFLGDVYLDGGAAQEAFTERLLVLPRSHFCYTPVGGEPEPSGPPCGTKGYVTFGSFNHFSKVSDEALRLWARILDAVPGSRLLLKGTVFDEADNRAYALARVARAGIAPERVEARGFSLDYLGEYADMDIALDTFPYPGGGTTCDALYMGVPVVTLAGADHGGRFGKSLLANLGLGELAADTPEDYVSRAVGLAGDRDLLAALRRNLRGMMTRSPLMDAARYRADLTAAYQSVWAAYVNAQPVPAADELPRLADEMEAFLAAGDARQALAAADGILAARPEDARLLARVAEAALRAGDARLARDAAARLMARDAGGGARYLAGRAAWLSGSAAEAARLLEEALADGTLAQDERGGAHALLGEALFSEGRYEEAARAYLAASGERETDDARAGAYSRYLCCLCFAGHGAEALYHAARRFGSFAGGVSPYAHDPAAARMDRAEDGTERPRARLRVGYLAADVRRGGTAPFMKALFLNLDRARFEAYGYTLEQGQEDGAPFEKTAWRDLSGLSPEEAARRIHEDEIDILVDLAGHASAAAPLILAHRPAPVQISGALSPMTTGLSVVDAFLADAHTAPEGEEAYFTEALVRLPESCFCFAPPSGAPRYPAPAPAESAGYVTFGVFSSPARVTEAALAAWAALLRRVEGARLCLWSDAPPGGEDCAAMRARFAAAGMDPARVELRNLAEDGLAAYERVDIALDTFPGMGRRAMCEALYMGVPVAALRGVSYASRAAESFLANVGLSGLCAPGWDAYVEAAADLARDRERLTDLHLTLRRRMLRSALMDGRRYINELEEAYGRLFNAWEKRAGEADYMKLLAKRLFRFRQAYAEKRWEEAAALGGRLAAAGVEAGDTCLAMVDIYTKLKDEAHRIYWIETAIAANPARRVRLLAYLGEALEACGYYEAAETARRRMMLSPVSEKNRSIYWTAMVQQAKLMHLLGRAEDSRRLYQEAYVSAKGFVEKSRAYGAALLAYNDMEAGEEALYRQSKAYTEIFRDVSPFDHTARKREKKKLRVGYLSPDFRNHVMIHFYWSFFAFENRERFTLYAYRVGSASDAYTDELRKYADVWRDMDGRTPEELARQIYEDEVDILFDLAGHTANNGLAALAYKPAPVQISGLGYMATTGLAAVDYFLTDALVDPPGWHEAFFTEKLLRVTTQFCYSPAGRYPASAGAPCKARGWVLFGVFNHYKKVTDEMLLAWREILERVPGSRLLLKSSAFGSLELQESAYRRMKALGLPMGRVRFEEATRDYMERYLEVDVALDTYPWTGGGTTCDALYMGVPVVSRYSGRRSTRFSYGLLHTAGAGELTAESVREYVEKAVALAQNEALLDTLHQKLRPMMQTSPLMDSARYVREIEAHYEAAYRAWLDGP